MYIPLNIITDYSILSSLIKVKDLVNICKNKGYKAIGISDNNLSYVMEFYNECIKNDIKPIIGYSFILDGKKVYLYAKNYKGYQNLCYISSNDISLDLVKNNIEGLFLVLPTESRVSVIFLTPSSSSDISAIPPALSAIGPKASIDTVVPTNESMPSAAIAIP